MRFKLIYVLLILIICCSLSCATAANINETDSNQTFQIETSTEDMTFEVNTPVSMEENYQDEGVSNLTLDNDDIILDDDGQMDLNDLKASKNPLYGLVDFGSNTIKLTIYELKKSGNIKSVFDQSEQSVTAIYVENNRLTPKGIDELVSILDDFNDIMDMVNVKSKYIFATASLRKIDNADEVIAIVKEQIGLDINLISGEKEANLSFNSIKDNEIITDDGIVIDLGGGSCEVIDFINKTPVSMESMPIGSNSIYMDYVTSMFPNETETVMIQNRVVEELKKLQITNTTKRYDLYGIGGSIRAIKKVLVYLDYLDKDTTAIPVSMLDTLLDEFRENTKENYLKIMNVNTDRVNTFVPGIIITKTVAEYFNVTTLHICKNCVREGIMAEIIENETRENSPDNGTFEALQLKITNAEEGATIKLLNNYTYDDSFTTNGILIDKRIIIDGNGFTINGLNKARIFNISAYSKVTLKNINFINGFAESGGAILFTNNVLNLIITDCIFENNTASSRGGAVAFTGEYVNNALISKNTFIKNTAKEGGSIIIPSECNDCNFTELNFTDNYAEYGACFDILDDINNVVFDKINFINNTAKVSAAAMFCGNRIYGSILSNITANNNTAGRTGGVFSFNGIISSSTFSKMTFTNNHAGDNGGALFFIDPIEYSIFDGMDFINNTSLKDGGGIYTTLVVYNNEFTNINFINNKASRNGGAFFTLKDFGGNLLDKCNFINNTANNGSAIYMGTNGIDNTLINLNFNNNIAGDSGIIYYSLKAVDEIISSKFIENSATGSAVIYFKGSSSTNILNCEFIDNIAGNISNLYYEGESTGNIKNSIFKGKNNIYISENSNILLENNTEIEYYPECYFVLNDGILQLKNNNLCNVIYNKGYIFSKTSIHVLNNQTVHVNHTPVNVSAWCIDDNANYIVSDNITFDIGGEKLTYEMAFNPIVSFDYELTKNGTFTVNASISSNLTDCDYFIGIIKNNKDNPDLNVSNVTVLPDEYAEIRVTLPENATGIVIFELNNVTYGCEINKGTVVFVAPKLLSGNYGVNVTYSGDDNYLSKSKKINIYVKSVIIEVYDMTRAFNSDYDYQVKLIDEAGNAIENKLVQFTISGKQYYAMTDKDGFARIKDGLKIGTYTVSVSSSLLDKSITKTLKIVKRITNNKNLNQYYNSNINYKVKIIGDDGKAETQGKNVKVTINSKTKTYKTDKNGFITIKLNKNIKPGKHTIKIEYKGYAESNKLIVKHTLSSKKTVKVKKSSKKILLKAKLKQGKKVIKNKQIKFKIKGKTYKAKTNKKGIAKISINKNKFKKGTYSIKISYLKETINTKIKLN